jgi:hypothetical protein
MFISPFCSKTLHPSYEDKGLCRHQSLLHTGDVARCAAGLAVVAIGFVSCFHIDTHVPFVKHPDDNKKLH